MTTVKITLELSPNDVIRVLTLLQDKPTSNVVTELPVVKPTIVPTAGKQIKMPGFGRNQKQIDTFTKTEQDRFDKKTEDELEKEQRAEERKVRQTEKQQVEDIKKETAKVQEAEVLQIKTAATENLDKVVMPKSPFSL